jgi:hypothetical protein
MSMEDVEKDGAMTPAMRLDALVAELRETTAIDAATDIGDEGARIIAEIEKAGIEIRDVSLVQAGHRGHLVVEACITLPEGRITYSKRIGHRAWPVDARATGSFDVGTAQEAVDVYQMCAAPETRAAAERADRQRSMDGQRSDMDDATIAAFGKLPPETVEAFRTIVAYLAIGERRGGADFRGVPVAAMLLGKLDAARANGLPEPRDASSETRPMTW